MTKACFVIILTFFAICELSKSVDINCKFGDVKKFPIGNTYYCTSNNVYIRSQEYAQINKVTGTHEGSKTNDDVLGYSASGGQLINYFPQGLDKFFKNLNSIAIWQGSLKEIHQSDLKPFTKLIYLNLFNNDLEVLEEGLLDFNPDLQVVGFHQNKLTHIDPNIFDNLSKLSNLWLDQVPCISKNSKTPTEIQDSIKTIKAQCTSGEFTSLNEKINSLENELKTLSSGEFSSNLDNFEKTFNDSKFLKFRPINYKLQNLKNFKVTTVTAPLTTVPTTLSKIDTCTNCCQINDIGNLTIEIRDKLVMTDGSVSDLKSSQDQIINSIENLTSKFTEREISHDKMKASISDIEVTLSDVKISQNEVLSSFLKLKTIQNEVKLAINDIRSNKADNSEEKISTFNEKLENLETLIAKVREKMEMEMSNTRRKISINIDEKIKGIEKRLMKKFEATLEDKLGKILEQVLGAMMKN